jgi:hypothetical protein
LAKGEADQFGAAAEFEFAEDAIAVASTVLGADVEGGGDVLGGPASTWCAWCWTAKK